MWTIQGNNGLGHSSMPSMNTLGGCINKVVTDGYKECFKVTSRGLYSTSRSRYYRPEQVQVIDSYRFEGQIDPHNNAIIYMVETSDGLKGTLIDAYGTYPDAGISQFVAQVEQIRKMMGGDNRHFC